MKGEIEILDTDSHEQIIAKIDDWIDYYNNDRPKWELTMLTPCEYAEYAKKGKYPLTIRQPKKSACIAIGDSVPELLGFVALSLPECLKKDDDESPPSV